MNSFRFTLILVLVCTVTVAAPAADSPSVARIWDEEILAAIRIDLPHPPAHARNLFHFSVAMYDAWAAYDGVAVGYLYHDKHAASDLAVAQREAISYAAYRLLQERYALSRGAAKTLVVLDARMAALGYDKDNRSLDPSTPAGLGNRVAAAVSSYFLLDGALQLNAYEDLPAAQGGYAPVNPPLATSQRGTPAIDVNRWQPLSITTAFSQNGLPINALQKFLGSQWKAVRPFALARDDPNELWIDPGPVPHLGGKGDAQFRVEVLAVIRRSSELTPDDGVVLDLSPGAFGNNALGASDGKGHPVNPATGLPYAPNFVKRGDFARVLAEFWADGPNSETPPGHWNSIANDVSDHPAFEKRFEGKGPVLDDLEWDVKLYFALNAAVHDAACAAWSVKREYDGWRAIEAIRFMGQLGQSSDPNLPSYHPNGLPLVPGLIELVTAQTSRSEERHSGLPIDTVAIFSWPGQPADPATQYSGVRWVLAADWIPYQKKTFVTPAFPGYISGHSTFSRSAAEVLTAITGTPFFPSGLGSYFIPATSSLTFEIGPSQSFELQWGTYFDAADQAGLSRIWGGIHPPVDDFGGRRVGAECGRRVWALARQYFDGSIMKAPTSLSMQRLAFDQCVVRYDTLRGFFYKLQSTSDLSQPFVDDPGGFTQALDSSVLRDDRLAEPARFYRVIRAAAP